MRKMKRAFPFIAIFCVLLSVLLVPASYAAAKSSGQLQHVYDNAGLLSTSDLNNLEDMCTKYSKNDKIDFIILTRDEVSTTSGYTYIENFNDEKRYLDSVILLVDMANREVVVQGYGIAESKINSKRATAIADYLSSYLGNEDYTLAFEKFIKKADGYITPIYMRSWLQLIVAIVIGAIAVAVMAFNAGGKMTANGSTYMDSNHSGLIGRRDDYIRTQVTRIRKPKNNSGSGGGGGISAGGLSHSSGSSKF